jgi:hypothetical protein
MLEDRRGAIGVKDVAGLDPRVPTFGADQSRRPATLSRRESRLFLFMPFCPVIQTLDQKHG